MKRELLLKKITELPKGTEICICDWRKNLHHADEEPQGVGIEPDFKVTYETEDVNKPFAALGFKNDDYNEDGNFIYGDHYHLSPMGIMAPVGPTGPPPSDEHLKDLIKNVLKEG